MGAGTETDIWNMGPVGGIVTGFVAGLGEVGNFVVVVAGGSKY